MFYSFIPLLTLLLFFSANSSMMLLEYQGRDDLMMIASIKAVKYLQKKREEVLTME